MSFQIGEVATLTGVPSKTIRYYESIGVLDAPTRASNGYRLYGQSTVDKLRFISRSRGLGFSLDSVRSLLKLWEDEGRASSEVKALALTHVAQVEQKIAELQGLRDTLMHLVDACQGDHLPDCPILEELSNTGSTDGSHL